MKILRHTAPARPSAPSAQQRAQFHRDLEALEDQTQGMAALARQSLDLSMRRPSPVRTPRSANR